MKVAVEGCCHGELDKIYETLQFLEKKENIKVDLLLICGDFQAVRNKSDFNAMAVPQKYQKLNTFYKYYSGEKKAPVLTVFVGGNHEASNYLQELPYGGWVAPHIYYMGYANVVQFGGIRIGGLSGIFKGRDYNKGHFERPPYNDNTKRSAYHVRSLEVFRLMQIKSHLDVFLSHDWPRGIYKHGDVQALLRKKSFFQDEIEKGILGSPAAESLLYHLKPSYWFAAHLHVKFAALVQHEPEAGSPDETENPKTTKFLALDKCLPKRAFLQVIDIPHDSNNPLQLELDPEWIGILQSTNYLLHLSNSNRYMPGLGSSERYDFSVSEQELKEIRESLKDSLKIPEIFERTVEPYRDTGKKKEKVPDPEIQVPDPEIQINPQTSLFCQMLGITDPFAVFAGKQEHNTSVTMETSIGGGDSSLIGDDIDDDDIQSDEEPPSFINSTMETTLDTSQDASVSASFNPDEISLDDLDEEDEDGSTSQSDSIIGDSSASGNDVVFGPEEESGQSDSGGEVVHVEVKGHRGASSEDVIVIPGKKSLTNSCQKTLFQEQPGFDKFNADQDEEQQSLHNVRASRKSIEFEDHEERVKMRMEGLKNLRQKVAASKVNKNSKESAASIDNLDINDDLLAPISSDDPLGLNNPIPKGEQSLDDHQLNVPMTNCSTPAPGHSVRTTDSSPHSPHGKRLNYDSDAVMASPIKLVESECDTSQENIGPAKAKKFKRRNKELYTSTDEDSSV